MGGKSSHKRELTWPRGVTARTFGAEQRIQVAFTYEGTQCRELMPSGTITQSAINHAAGLRLEISRKIHEGTFVYREYFPNSTAARRFEAASNGQTLESLLATQLKLYEKQVKNNTLSPSTLDGYRKAIRSERMAKIKHLTLHEATPARLRDWISDMDTTAKRARNLLTPLRSVFEDALNNELIEANPFDRIALNKLLRQTKRQSEYEVDPFTAAEREALVRAARADERAMVQFWFNAGLRPGELIALRWDRVDWIEHKVRIDLNVVAKTEKGPKTEAGKRDLELDAGALAALQAQKVATFLHPSGRVWLNPRTGEPWETEAQIRKTMWDQLCKRAGVRYRSPYQARHTYASSRLTAGANPWYIAQQLGHVDVQMVFKVYGKFIAADYQRPRATAKQAQA